MSRWTRSRRVRWLVRCTCLVAAAAALWPAVPGRWPALVPALSPFTAVGALLATRTAGALACLGLTVGLITLLRRRWFCRWVCPMGLCADVATGLGRHWGRRRGRVAPLGRWTLLLTLGGACLGYPLLLWLDPGRACQHEDYRYQYAVKRAGL